MYAYHLNWIAAGFSPKCNPSVIISRQQRWPGSNSDLATILGCREQWVRSSRRRAAGAVRARDRLEHMPVGVFEVHPAAAIPLVDLIPLSTTRVGPIGQMPFPNAREDLVEFGLGYQKCVMLRSDLAVAASVLFDIHGIQRGVPYRYDRKMPQPYRRRQTEYLGQEFARRFMIVRGDDCVIQTNGHGHVPFLASGVRISLPYLSFIFFKAGWNNQDFLTHHITSLFAFLLV